MPRARLEVKAPVAGKIVTVLRESPGSVVKPGETLMELLPDHDQLVVEAHVSPNDIDTVAPDAKARVRLTAYSMRPDIEPARPRPGGLRRTALSIRTRTSPITSRASSSTPARSPSSGT